ncbi:hypothetical protein HPB47_011634, partial [Ixodes persulcatus]
RPTPICVWSYQALAGRSTLKVTPASSGRVAFAAAYSAWSPVSTGQRLAASAKLDKLTSYGAINTYTAKGVCGMPARGVCAAVADKIINFGSKYANMLMISQKPQKFDYGPEKNTEVYGQAEPPLYSLDPMTTDVGVFWSLGDRLVFPDTVAQLIKDLGPRVKKSVFIDDPDYTHINFVIALNNPEVLFPDLLEFLAGYLGPCHRVLEPDRNEE